MADAENTVPAARRHLIRRPRLTTLLEESGARVILLAAPAGFGKTTLAQQWVEDRQHAWYRGGPASSDVAALAAGIAQAASKLVPGSDKRIRERLTATRDAEADAEILAEIVAEDLEGWPADAWLVLDDYQYAMESAASERFVEALIDRTEIRLVVTSRTRPTWATCSTGGVRRDACGGAGRTRLRSLRDGGTTNAKQPRCEDDPRAVQRLACTRDACRAEPWRDRRPRADPKADSPVPCRGVLRLSRLSLGARALRDLASPEARRGSAEALVRGRTCGFGGRRTACATDTSVTQETSGNCIHS